MLKACGRCGKVHEFGKVCYANEYKDSLEHKLRSKYVWTVKAEQIKERANYLCEVCRDKGVYTYDGLEVHHIAKLRNAPHLLLDDANLICLCQEHHKAADRGEIDMEYLKQLAAGRDGR